MLKNHRKAQLLYTEKHDVSKYYEIISVDAYYSNSMVVFILHFPLLHPEQFIHYHLYSVPTVSSTTIIPPSPYLTLNNEFHQYSNQPCKKLKQEYLCQSRTMQYNSRTPDCVAQILQLSQEEALCNQVPVTINTTLVEEITEAHYIVIFPHPIKISTKCKTTSMIELQGNFIIELPPGCEFSTTQDRFVNTKEITREQPMTLPKVRVTAIQQSRKSNPIHLEKVPLDELDKLQKEQHRIYPQPLEVSTDTTHLWSTPIYVLVMVGIVWSIYKLHQKISCTKKTPESTASRESNPVLFIPHRTFPRDGGVTS